MAHSEYINIYYGQNAKKKELTQSILRHIKSKAGYDYGDIVLKALHEYNLTLDEKGNKI